MTSTTANAHLTDTDTNPLFATSFVNMDSVKWKSDSSTVGKLKRERMALLFSSVKLVHILTSPLTFGTTNHNGLAPFCNLISSSPEFMVQSLVNNFGNFICTFQYSQCENCWLPQQWFLSSLSRHIYSPHLSHCLSLWVYIQTILTHFKADC